MKLLNKGLCLNYDGLKHLIIHLKISYQELEFVLLVNLEISVKTIITVVK